MAVVFEKPTLTQRLLPLFRGFDLPLLFLVMLLASAGLLAMYSSGYDHGTRFADHGRNMLIAVGILFMVAQVPPQKIMACAVPLYVAGVALLVAARAAMMDTYLPMCSGRHIQKATRGLPLGVDHRLGRWCLGLLGLGLLALRLLTALLIFLQLSRLLGGLYG